MSESKTNKELLEEIESLKRSLLDREEQINRLKLQLNIPEQHCLTKEEILRYSRQIFVDLVAVKGQEKLKRSSALIVGCGGLGCPASQYLASVGFGKLGLVDYDEVELNNLHRQVLHSEESVGQPKVDSLTSAINRLNSNVVVEKHRLLISSSNALSIIGGYDVVLDCTDNPATRYLLNDACVLSGKPLISGAAVRTEGQLTVYNHDGGPCFRCLFPQPPPSQAVANCGDVGVLPHVPGVIGVLEALQAVHIALGNSEGVLSQRMLLFDGEQTMFRTIKLRGKSKECSVCGSSPTITGLVDYEQFCGSPANDKMRGVKLIKSEERATITDLREALKREENVVIDVRSPTEFQLCRIPSSVNIPLEQIDSDSHSTTTLPSILNSSSKVFVICRRGNDSQIACAKLRGKYPDSNIVDVIGGLHAWSAHVDPSFPAY